MMVVVAHAHRDELRAIAARDRARARWALLREQAIGASLRRSRALLVASVALHEACLDVATTTARHTRFYLAHVRVRARRLVVA